jgi:ABC-type spermidine/putrescine transport system permease subunit II
MNKRALALWVAAILAYMFLYAPLAIVVVYSFNDSRLNAEWVGFTLAWYELPLIMPGVVAGALMAFTLSIDDFVITFFTAGVGSTTLPLQIYTMVKIAVTPEVNAVSTLLMMLTLALILIASRLAPGSLRSQ